MSSLFSRIEGLVEKAGYTIPSSVGRLFAGLPNSVTLRVISGENLRGNLLHLKQDPYLEVTLLTARPPSGTTAPAPLPPTAAPTTTTPAGAYPAAATATAPRAPPQGPPPNTKISPVVPSGGASPTFNMATTFPCDAAVDGIRVTVKNKTLAKLGAAASLIKSAAGSLEMSSAVEDAVVRGRKGSGS